MGMTGAGKSSFISRVTGLQEEAGVGHSLSSSQFSISTISFAVRIK